MGRAIFGASPSQDLARVLVRRGGRASASLDPPKCASEQGGSGGSLNPLPSLQEGETQTHALPCGVQGAVGDIRIRRPQPGELPSRPSCAQK